MNFREFATNYLNPIFLLYRVVLFGIAGFLLLLSTKFVANSGGLSGFETFVIYIASLFISGFLVIKIIGHPFLLYLFLPMAGVITPLIMAESGSFSLILSMLYMASVYLIVWNAMRSWGYGISINDLKNMSNNRSK